MIANNRRGLLVLCLLLVATLGACGGGNSALDPKFQPQVTNQADNFQFQTTGITGVTQTLTYTWQNTGIRASTNQACSITAGTAIVVIRDASGALVYSADLAANGTFTTTSGTTGNWTIVVTLSGVSGTLNFRVQKA